MLLRSLTLMALEMVQHCPWKTSYWLKSVTSVAYWLYALEKEMVFLSLFICQMNTNPTLGFAVQLLERAM